MIVKPLLIHALEAALNQYLSLDNNIETFLQPLAGKVIAITIEPVNDTIYLCPGQTQIQILDNYPGEVDTTLSGNLLAFGFMGLSESPMRSVYRGEVKISGDMHTGRAFQHLFDQLDLNLERKLAQITGDKIAGQIAGFFRNGKQWTKDSLETLRLNVQEFLQEETRDLPEKPEADLFFQQVDELRSDYDRLAARIERLNRQFPTA